jgi:DHA1 family inner membrane transport protein
LTLATGAIGFGGLFAVYTYLGSTLVDVTGVAAHSVPLVLAAFGVGMTAGNLLVPMFADRALMPTAGALLVWEAVVLALYPLAAANYWTVMLDVFAIHVDRLRRQRAGTRGSGGLGAVGCDASAAR